MAENSKIEWCDHTFNPWTGCAKVSPGCANCYAEGWAKRSGHVQWGPGKPRRRTSAAEWRKPVRWNTAENSKLVGHAEFVENRRPRVFCASLADWLDDEVPIEWLADLLLLIHQTPNLDWLLLTKRPQNFDRRVRAPTDLFLSLGAVGEYSQAGKAYADWLADWMKGRPPENVWIGTTVEDQQRADERIPVLLSIPARVRFLSCEPLLGPVDVRFGFAHLVHPDRPTIHWVIAGGESGPGARPMHPEWARGLRDQCAAAGVPFLFKQWGDWLPYGECAPGVDDPRDKEGVLHNYSFGATAPVVPWYSRKLGKARAGRLLDGREWNEFPEGKAS